MNSFIAKRKRYLFRKKRKDVSVQTEFCNPIQILIDKITTFHSLAITERAKIEKNLEALKNQNTELQLMVKLFQKGCFKNDPIPSSKDVELECSKISDPENRNLVWEKHNLLKNLRKEQDVYCDLVMKLKNNEKGREPKLSDKAFGHAWNDCFKDFVKVDGLEKQNVSPMAQLCHKDKAYEIKDLTMRNAAVLKQLWLYKQMHRKFYSNTSWTPQVYVALKTFLTRQQRLEFQLMNKYENVGKNFKPNNDRLKDLPFFLKKTKKTFSNKFWRY